MPHFVLLSQPALERIADQWRHTIEWQFRKLWRYGPRDPAFLETTYAEMVLDVVAEGLDKQDRQGRPQPVAVASGPGVAPGLPPGASATDAAYAAGGDWMPPPSPTADVSVSTSKPVAVEAFRQAAEDGATGEEALAAAFRALREEALAQQEGRIAPTADAGEEMPAHVRAMLAEMGLLDNEG